MKTTFSGRKMMRYAVVAWLTVPMMSACATHPLPGPESGFRPPERAREVAMLSKEDLALLNGPVDPVYRLGSGDTLRLSVFGRPEVSGQFLIGPDGVVTIPLIGNLMLNDSTREEAQQRISQQLRGYFTRPYVTLAVDDYGSNQVTVLGRVQNAGRQKFPAPPTLAEVLANAGAMPILDKQATLTRCAIIRGREKLIWVDLKALLNGDLAYNIVMKRGDIVFIPDSSETAVYVLGAVPKPGSYRLTPHMSVLDALAQAGGPDENAKPEAIGIYRAGARQVETISFNDLIAPQRAVNFGLEDGDVVFVPRSGVADLGYFLRQITPAVSVLTFGLTANALMKNQ
ncbi:Putative capsular polysaccharide export protein [Laribacter hongkongensis HLHK9]|uniref:Capsular polysaccharide export protein n=2 Tax=Laribacter hongkongensis TaxID=168471 RepID=C1D4M6_LARHH|nr:Putative capsular polysaccharide export protein [Laribacter hongkongensis HLHK9]